MASNERQSTTCWGGHHKQCSGRSCNCQCHDDTPDGLVQIGWWLPYDSPLTVDEDQRFISLRASEEEGGIREPYKTEVVPAWMTL